MRWLLRFVYLVIVLAVLAGAAWVMIPKQKIAEVAAAQFEAATGRKMTIEGGVHATLWPEPGVRIGKVTIANAAWSKDGPMVSAASLQLGVAWSSLTGGDIRITKVMLEAPQLLLERAKNGAVNWDFRSAKAPVATGQGATGEGAAPQGGAGQPAAAGATAFSLDDLRINKGEIRWIDHAAGSRYELSAIDGEVKLPAYRGPAEFEMAAVMRGRPLQLKGQIERFDRFAAGAATAVTVNAMAGNSRLDFTGSAGMAPLAIKGGLDAHLGDLASVFAAMGQKAPDLPQGLGHRLIAVKGQIGLGADGILRLDKARIDLDSNRLNGDIAVTTAGTRPRINAKLSGDVIKIALSPAAAGGGGGGGAPPAADGWSKAPLDVVPLRAIDADLALSVQGLDLGQMVFGRSDVAVNLAGGRARVNMAPVTAYQGALTGQVTLDAAGKTPVMAGDVTIKNMALQPLLRDFADYRRLIGTGTLALKWQGRGASMAALMSSLSGNGSVDIGKGELQGLDLVGMLTHLDPNYVGPGAKTIFDAITATFSIQNGILSNNDLALTAPLITAKGSGTVDLGRRQLNYTVVPTALKGQVGSQGVSVPLKISGSWMGPKFGLDMNAAVTQKARDAARKAIEKQLGLTPPAAPAPAPGATGVAPAPAPAPTDPRKALEDAAKKQLLKMLGGGN